MTILMQLVSKSPPLTWGPVMHCWFRQWMLMSYVNLCDGFWFLTKSLKRRACIIKLCAFYLSCSPRSPVVWTRIFLVVCLYKYCPSCASVFVKSINFAQENVKNCTLFSHFPSVSGGFVPIPGLYPWTPVGDFRPAGPLFRLPSREPPPL